MGAGGISPAWEGQSSPGVRPAPPLPGAGAEELILGRTQPGWALHEPGPLLPLLRLSPPRMCSDTYQGGSEAPGKHDTWLPDACFIRRFRKKKCYYLYVQINMAILGSRIQNMCALLRLKHRISEKPPGSGQHSYVVGVLQRKSLSSIDVRIHALIPQCSESFMIWLHSWGGKVHCQEQKLPECRSIFPSSRELWVGEGKDSHITQQAAVSWGICLHRGPCHRPAPVSPLSWSQL